MKSVNKLDDSLTGYIEETIGEKLIDVKPVLWTEIDMIKALTLSENGNLKCLTKLFDLNFDSFMVSPGGLYPQGYTLAMAAARAGQIGVLDFLMGKEINMSVRDSSGRTLMHYAAMCLNESMVPFLLTHAKTKICKYHMLMLRLGLRLVFLTNLLVLKPILIEWWRI
jgi:hypothetical protein